MFTGIIQHVGTLERTAGTPAGQRLYVDVGPLTEALKLGDSIAVNGACLTAAEIAGAVVGFDAVPETLAKTTLGRLTAGVRVNCERALRLGDGLDGHLVQGHVDGQASLTRIDRSSGQWALRFACAKALTDEMVAKGSIAIDGISLTLVTVADGTFSVAIIPTTLAETALADRREGDHVNIETDILGKYVRRFVGGAAADESGVTFEKLRRQGYM